MGFLIELNACIRPSSSGKLAKSSGLLVKVSLRGASLSSDLLSWSLNREVIHSAGNNSSAQREICPFSGALIACEFEQILIYTYCQYHKVNKAQEHCAAFQWGVVCIKTRQVRLRALTSNQRCHGRDISIPKRHSEFALVFLVFRLHSIGQPSREVCFA